MSMSAEDERPDGGPGGPPGPPPGGSAGNPPGGSTPGEPESRRRLRLVLILAAAVAAVTAIIVAGVTSAGDRSALPGPAASPTTTATGTPESPEPGTTPGTTPDATPDPGPSGSAQPGSAAYPWHTDIVSTTFWVGEVFDPNAADGSQVYSTYDSGWMESYGGCDGIRAGTDCETEVRTAENGFFPSQLTPLENPFYLDLPFDDVNDRKAFASREQVVPWAGQAAYRGSAGNDQVSLMKNRWVRIRSGGQTCYGQIQDAGPGQYHDAAYVFGAGDARPANAKFNGAGMDVSPALNGCLRFTEIDGQTDRVDWQFVEAADVPDGPWSRIVTTSGVR
jgi:hypothetical protein